MQEKLMQAGGGRTYSYWNNAFSRGRYEAPNRRDKGNCVEIGICNHP